MLDIIVVFSFYFFADTIRARQLEYIKEFKQQTITMADYTVRI